MNLSPVDPDRPDLPASFHLSADLDITPEALFDLLVAPEPWKDWFPDIVDVAWTSAPPHGVGSQRRVKMRTNRVSETFTVYEPGRRWAFYVHEMALPLVSHFAEDYKLEPLADGRTRLTWDVWYRPRPWIRPLHPLLRPVFAKMFRDGLRNLGAYVTTAARPDSLG